jgi:peptidoglycan/xylan/chitin deacetylase (PgdA/CDA1 family)
MPRTRISRARQLVLLLAGMMLALPATAAATTPTIVSLTFDGATTDQSHVGQMLAARGLQGTFFVNSGNVGSPGHLGWSALQDLATAGNEIGGATTTGAWLPGLPSIEALNEVCDDRNALLARGFAVRSFAYPYRDATSANEAMVHQCGYDSGRGGGGWFHDWLPPKDPYLTITPPAVTASTTLDQLIAQVTNTTADGGGWTTFQIGQVCAGCGAGALDPTTLGAFLDWLGAQQAAGALRVSTVGNVIDGPLAPSVFLPRAPTIVTLSLDDGLADQRQAVRMLSTHHLHATFYVNSGEVGQSGQMSWKQLLAVQAAGNEVGGHTTDEPDDLTVLPPAQQRSEVCGDRASLIAHRLAIYDFAFPHFPHDATTEQLVADCGYDSGRSDGGLQCTSCMYAETVPPQDPFAVQTVANVLVTDPLSQVEGNIQTVENLGGGWLTFAFHHLCPGQTCGAYSWPPDQFDQLLSWLQSQVDRGLVVVRTMHQVIGGPLNPPPAN